MSFSEYKEDGSSVLCVCGETPMTRVFNNFDKKIERNYHETLELMKEEVAETIDEIKSGNLRKIEDIYGD